jgi:hypothetical protein
MKQAGAHGEIVETCSIVDSFGLGSWSQSSPLQALIPKLANLETTMAYELVGTRLITSFPVLEAAAGPHLLGRGEERSPVAVPLVVCGLNSSGRLFFELALIHDISRSGCRIHLCTRPQCDSPLVVRLVTEKGETRQEIAQMLFQVTWIEAEAEGWAVGAHSLGSKDLRTLVFPA